MYGLKCSKLNNARYEKFLATYNTNNPKVFMKKVVSYDSSNLPPCKRELHQQLLRTAYITNIWRNCNLKEPTILTPENNGWNSIDSRYEFNWFEGNTVPSSIYDILLQGPADTATAQSTETEECISDEENIVEESDDDENSDSEISDDAEENEC
ncbi:uncharacterized protein LOC123317674 [Coccinella septempunctata]|uniref:uncharacterized protein LOC123317674 n=1 Tax=Coccinella septempunctata TaxID=41139 RepID=UPI001D085E00|nr:uncharacterized protein LOC123317674 [Coccinella septempunctata]